MTRTALVTGASGGLGEAFVDLLARQGYRLMIAARNADQLNRVAGLATARHQADVSVIIVDLSRHDAGEIIRRELAAHDFSPDVVINNAGFGKLGQATALDRAEQVNMVDLNVRCATDLTLRFLPGMIKRGRGGILNVASLAGYMPGPYMAVYYASKNYLVAFSEALHTELKGTGVTVSALCPGIVNTGFQARAGMEGSRMVKWLPGMSAADVAAAGWEGFTRGERVIIPGTMYRISGPLARMSPRALLLPVVAWIQRPNKQDPAGG